jgi:hypothetical protein
MLLVGETSLFTRMDAVSPSEFSDEKLSHSIFIGDQRVCSGHLVNMIDLSVGLSLLGLVFTEFLGFLVG